jgi:tRNA A58 N-methylase Trm61
MRDYKFTAVCKSGQVKTFEFQAANYLAARKKLQELIDSN